MLSRNRKRKMQHEHLPSKKQKKIPFSKSQIVETIVTDSNDIDSFLNDSDESSADESNFKSNKSESQNQNPTLDEGDDDTKFTETDINEWNTDDLQSGDIVETDEFDLSALNNVESNTTMTQPKISLMSDNDDDDGNDNNDADDDTLAIEKMAAMQSAKNSQIMLDNEAELKEQISNAAPLTTNFVFPSYKRLMAEKSTTPDLKILKQRIEDCIEILSNFKALRDDKHSRKEYLSLLGHALSRYYGYSLDLINMFLTIFHPSECLAFLEANEQQRPVTIRTNTLKTRRRDLAKALIERGVNLDPLADWTKTGLKIIDTQVPIGATPEYLAGYYMVQSAASLLPVLALDIKPHQKCLDMSAAPGGKATHMAQILKNSGLLVANDVNKERLKAVFGNMHRMGVNNCIVMNCDGREMPSHFHPIFDRVLLDAPCSCLGVISRDPQIKYSKTFNDVTTMSALQKELILAAIDCLKVGGIIVYSTCSISPYENEGVVNYALEHRYVRIVESGLEFGEEGFARFKHFKYHPSLKMTRRYYPHSHNLDGFYVAKLEKVDKGKKGETRLTSDHLLNADAIGEDVFDDDRKSRHKKQMKPKKKKKFDYKTWGGKNKKKLFPK